jgi:addiction module RelB/DinJ family antitoxin
MGGSSHAKTHNLLLDIAYTMTYYVYIGSRRQIMVKDSSISIRLDSQLKEQTERVLEQLGLSMTAVVNMLFLQIVREQAVPLSLSLKTENSAMAQLDEAKAERLAGYVGRTADNVAKDMERIIAEIENGS